MTRQALKTARLKRQLQGYDPYPPRCANCKRYVKGLPPIGGIGGHVPPFCSVSGETVSATAICDFWQGLHGDTLEPEPTSVISASSSTVFSATARTQVLEEAAREVERIEAACEAGDVADPPLAHVAQAIRTLALRNTPPEQSAATLMALHQPREVTSS